MMTRPVIQMVPVILRKRVPGFWHESTNESESDTEDTEDDGYSDVEESDLDIQRSKTKKEAPTPKSPKRYIGIRREKINYEGSMETVNSQH